MSNKFVADVHLGKLARLLRLLGFDTLYKNDYTSKEFLQIGSKEDRIVLSRNSSLVRNKELKCLIIASEDPLLQLKQVVHQFGLKNQIHPFTRCIICNGILKPVAKESVHHQLQKNTVLYFNEFWQCQNCKRIYWKGSHYERMKKTIESIAS